MIPEHLIDVDFSNQSDRLLGCARRSDRCGDAAPVFEDRITPIDRSQWATLIAENRSLETQVAKIKDQGQEGTCASNATCQTLEIALNLELGRDCWLEFSPISIYRWIAPGPGSGSTIGDNLKQLRDSGALPVNSTENRNKMQLAGLDPAHVLRATGYSQSFPSGWQSTAAHFRGVEFFDLSSFEGFVTALLLGFAICYGRQGHAICAVAPVIQNGGIYIKYANSWGDWGENGFGYDSESKIAGSIRSYGAWALRAANVSDKMIELKTKLREQNG